MKHYRRAFTHAGKFHADDVFSSVLLHMLAPNLPITRVQTLPDDFDSAHDLAFDIGGGEFDHHQPHAPVRENGIPYAAFGLLWRAFGAELVGDAEAAANIARDLVEPLDKADNGGTDA